MTSPQLKQTSTPGICRRHLPDISGLELVKDDKPIQEDNPEEAVSIPDTSHLEAEPAKSGSLEEFTQEKEPVEVPDISNLSLDR